MLNESNLSPLPGAILLRPLEEGQRLPDVVNDEVMRLTCVNWLRRNWMQPSGCKGLEVPICVPVGGEQFVICTSRDDHPLPIHGSETAVYLVAQQWVEDAPTDTGSLAAFLQGCPAWLEAQALMRAEVATMLWQYQCLPEPPPVTVDGIRHSLEHRLFGPRLVDVLRQRNLPATPGTCAFFVAEILRANGIAVPDGQYAPTRGLLIESLFVAPAPLFEHGSFSFDARGFPVATHGDVISAVVSQGEWSGEAWERVGRAIRHHRNWWKKSAISRALDNNLRVHNRGKRGQRSVDDQIGDDLLGTPAFVALEEEALRTGVMDDVQGKKPGPRLADFWQRVYAELTKSIETPLTREQQEEARSILRKRIRRCEKQQRRQQ